MENKDRAVVVNNEQTFEGYIAALMRSSARQNDVIRSEAEMYNDKIEKENFDLASLSELRHRLSEMQERVSYALHLVEKAETIRRFVECPHDVSSYIAAVKVAKRREKNNGE